MDPVILRLIERIIAVIIGGISVYLGYRLFLHLPNEHNAEGKVMLPGDISVYVSRVGPGVFFGLFGAGVVALSLYTAVTFREPGRGVLVEAPQNGDAPVTLPPREFTGFGPNPTSLEGVALETQRLRVRRDIILLNALPTSLSPDLSQARRTDVNLAISRIKLALMSTLWDEDWGSYADFEGWIDQGEPATAPESLQPAIEYYRYGEGRSLE